MISKFFKNQIDLKAYDKRLETNCDDTFEKCENCEYSNYCFAYNMEGIDIEEWQEENGLEGYLT